MMRLSRIFALICLLAALAANQVYGQSAPAETTLAATTQPRQLFDQQAPDNAPDVDPADSSELHRRVVDINEFPKRGSLVGRILLAPFRAFAPYAEEGATFAEKRFLRRGQSSARSGLSIQPIFGFPSDAAGLGGGVLITKDDLFVPELALYQRTRVTLKRYFETALGLQYDRGEKRAGFTINLEARYRLLPEEAFWGTGPASLRGQRTSYYLQERGAALTVRKHLSPSLQLGATIDYSSNRVFAGRANQFASIEELFPALPGLAQGAALFGALAFAELDLRDNPDYPHKGLFLHLNAASYDSVGREDFGYFSYHFDARGYLPLATHRRVLALRVMGDFNRPKGNSAIPFFRLARLGTFEMLRGYDPYRFHDRNALAASIEYRYEIGRYIDAIAFSDGGQVFNKFSQFNTSNIHVTFGGGIQFKSESRVAFRLLVGKSGESTRLIFAVGPTF